MRRLRAWLAAGAAAAALAGPALAAGGQTDWYVLTTATGATVGFGSVELRRTAEGVEKIERQETTLREGDARPTRFVQRTVSRWDREGRLLSLESESLTGRRRVVTELRPRPGGVEVRRSGGRHGRSVETVPLAADVRLDDGEPLIAAWRPETDGPLAFSAFSLDAMAAERIVLTPAPGAARDAEGRLEVLRARYDGEDLRGVSRLTLDRDGRIVAVVQPMYGTSVGVRPATQAEALAARAPYRMVTALTTKSPFRIPGGAAEGHIRYRFGFRDGMAFPLPRTGEQRATVGADGGVTLDICDGCGPGLPTDAAYLAHARQPTPWLQTGDRRIRAMAKPVAAMAVSDARKMEILARTARSRLGEIDFAGHYSASETLDRGRGDCTEAAVLLATLGRAAGIPTRTVSGWVYSRERYHGVGNVFIPHSWTLAYVDGKWRSFDAALGEFDSTHIAVTVGDGDARSMAAAGQLAGLLTWESMAEVKRRPAA